MSERTPERAISIMDTAEAQLSLEELLSTASLLLSRPNTSPETLLIIQDRLYDEVEVHQHCPTGISLDILVTVADTIEALSAAISNRLRS